MRYTVFIQQEFGQADTVLTGNSSDQCNIILKATFVMM